MPKNSDMNNYLAVRVGGELRTEFAKFCKAQDMTPSQVIKMFVHYYIRTKDAQVCFRTDDVLSDNSGKSENLSIWLSAEDRKAFADVAVPNMSTLVRGYMRYCIANGIPAEILSFDSVQSTNREILQMQIDKIKSIETPLSEGSVDAATAKRFADDLNDVCDQINLVIDAI